MTTTREAILTLIEVYGTYFVLNEEFIREYKNIIYGNCISISPSSCSEQTEISTHEIDLVAPLSNEQKKETNGDTGHVDIPSNSKQSYLSPNELQRLCNLINYNKISIGTTLNGVIISETLAIPKESGFAIRYKLCVHQLTGLRGFTIQICCFDINNSILSRRAKPFRNNHDDSYCFDYITTNDGIDIFQIHHIQINVVP